MKYSELFTDIEEKQYQRWLDLGLFKAKTDQSSSSKGTYSVVIPPPNVTGSLHIGHALNHIIQDIMVRVARMRKKNVLWQPGTDHAGIATQMVVERELAKENKSRLSLGRDEFIKRIWQWREESGDSIIKQQQKLGESCDWERSRFTLDEGLAEAVKLVFVKLYEDGLIFRDYRLVNWDVRFETAISDIEVVFEERQDPLYTIKYPVNGGGFIEIATVRPETILGDVAVAVHPEDPRYKNLIGKICKVPIVDREVKIIADEMVDIEYATGAVKITPAHDSNDFEVGKRHNLPVINIFDTKGRLNDAVPSDLRGIERFKARKIIKERLDSMGLISKSEVITHSVPLGDRSGEVVEPYLTDQWFVNTKTLAEKAIEAVKRGDTRITPKTYEKDYFRWLENIQPWCISRQIWWGHRIPAWYGSDGKIFVGIDEAAALKVAKKHYGKDDVTLTQDPDVLDTWFSSALWPFSTLGWPEKTPDYETFFPRDLLVTAHDILFFWVARMMMISLHFTKQVPFKDVYIHALVRDSKGQKMSKSKGNVLDPLAMIKKFGADSLRFALAQQSTPGRDVIIDEKRVDSGKAFGTKIWNAARFLKLNEIYLENDFDPAEAKVLINRWVLARLGETSKQANKELESFRIDEYTNCVYHFIWSLFCDWYVEAIKPILAESETQSARQKETKQTAAYVFAELLKLLHPVMPFVTEHLWLELQKNPSPAASIMLEEIFSSKQNDLAEIHASQARAQQVTIDLISQIRKERHALGVDPSAIVGIKAVDKKAGAILADDLQAAIIKRLARVEVRQEVENGIELYFQGMNFFLGLDIDRGVVLSRQQDELHKLEKHIASFKSRLSDASFVNKAPKNIVDESKRKLASVQQEAKELLNLIERLK